MRIEANPSASGLLAYNAFVRNNNALVNVVERLSTGLRINRSADGAAELAMAAKLRSQSVGQRRAMENTAEGRALANVADGALGEVQSLLHRMRDLAVRASSDTLTSDDRVYVQLEINELIGEIDRVSRATQYNGKQLLNGNASGTWGSSHLATIAMLRGSVGSAAGNYRIDIDTRPGWGQVLKTNLYKIFEARYHTITKDDAFSGWGYVTEYVVDPNHTQTYLGVGAVLGAQGGTCGHFYVEGLQGGFAPGQYGVSFPNQLVSAVARVAQTYNMSASDIYISPDFPPGTLNSNILFEAVAFHEEAKAITFKAFSRRFDSMGNLQPDIITYVTLSREGIVGDDVDLGLIGNMGGEDTEDIYSMGTFRELGIDMDPTSLRLAREYDQYSLGAKFLINVIAPDTIGTGAGIPIRIESPGGTQYLEYNMSSNLSGTRSGILMPYIYLDKATGAVAMGEVVARYTNLDQQRFPHSPTRYFNAVGGVDETLLEPIDIAIEMISSVYQKAYERTFTLAETAAFVDANGRSIFADSPQRLTIYQGDGRSTSLTLYGYETFQELAEMLNESISALLGQGIYVDDRTHFSNVADGSEETSEAAYSERRTVIDVDVSDKLSYRDESVDVYATLLIRSALPGRKGELRFSGSDDLLKALGISTIQESRESVYDVVISDAHSGALHTSAKTYGNTLFAAIGDKLDLEFDLMANTYANWNDDTKRYVLYRDDGSYTTYLHLTNRSLRLQVGANEGEDMDVSVGATDSQALGLKGLLVIDHESAVRAVSMIDVALFRVSSQRSLLGAYRNRLGHTADRLAGAETNTNAAESRIRYADIGLEAVQYAKLSLLSRTSAFMTSRAGQQQNWGSLNFIR